MTAAYYESLAPWYRLMYADWDASVARQAKALDQVIRTRAGAAARRVLDAACGMGTQALGLAALGYEVTALDLSPALVARARAEAARRGLEVKFGVCDMRAVGAGRAGCFDAVIACDNAVPHLADEGDIFGAFRQFHACLVPGGCVAVSVRDYAAIERVGTRINPRLVHEDEGATTALFDVWRFDADRYEFTTYVVEDSGAEVRAHAIRGGRYLCVEIDVLERLMHEAGFVDVRTDRDRFFQPLVVGTRLR